MGRGRGGAHRWRTCACACAAAAAARCGPSGWASSGSTPRLGTGRPARRARARSTAGTPATQAGQRPAGRALVPVLPGSPTLRLPAHPAAPSAVCGNYLNSQRNTQKPRTHTFDSVSPSSASRESGHVLGRRDGWADRWPRPGPGTCLTSRESPDMTKAQSCFLRKAFSSRWASPRLATCREGPQPMLSKSEAPTNTRLFMNHSDALRQLSKPKRCFTREVRLLRSWEQPPTCLALTGL